MAMLSELLPHLHEDDDPHLLLNASKAPTPGQEWSSPTSSEWEAGGRETGADLNISIIPMDMMASELTNMDKSCWEAEPEDKKIRGFNFLMDFEQCGAQEQGLKQGSFPPRFLSSPCDIALVAAKWFLVSEPKRNKIGIYSADSLEFLNWCNYPVQALGENVSNIFFYPTNILATSQDFVFILVKEGILVLNSGLLLHQPLIRGRFAGLAEDKDGDVFTLQVGPVHKEMKEKWRILSLY